MKQQPLLMSELSDAKRAALATLVQQPGWAVVEELHMDACKRATEELVKLNPAEEGNDRKVVVLQQRARERNEFSLLILSSIDWHVRLLALGKEEKNEAPAENPIVKGLNRQ